MSAHDLDWSDVPFVLAVCEAGSLSGAARALGAKHSTVYRRLEALQNRLGVRLFERMPHGYVMTSAGEFFFEAAIDIREGMTNIERKLSGKDHRLEGALAVTTTNSLFFYLVPLFAKFQNAYSNIELTVITDVKSFDLSKRTADIALRPPNKPPDHWSGRNLATLEFATYAHQSYLDEVSKLDPEERRWVQLDDALSMSPMGRLAARLKPSDAPVTIANSIMGVLDFLRAGHGIAALPCYLGETVSGLVRVDDPLPEFNWELWVLSHPDLRKSARVRPFFDFVAHEIKDYFPIFP